MSKLNKKAAKQACKALHDARCSFFCAKEAYEYELDIAKHGKSSSDHTPDVLDAFQTAFKKLKECELWIEAIEEG